MLCTTPSLGDVLVMKLWFFTMNMICIKELCISVIAIGYVGDTHCVVCLATALLVNAVSYQWPCLRHALYCDTYVSKIELCSDSSIVTCII